MANIRLTQRYAKALHELAVEMNKTDEVRQDVQFMHDVIKISSELAAMLKSPVILGNQKLKVVQGIFQNKIQQLSLQFIELMIRKNREEHLFDITKAYFDIDYAHRGITPLTITTAQKVSEESLNHIVDKLKSAGIVKEVELTVKEDEKLLGGFVLNFHDKLLDASVSRKLELFKKQFEDNVYVKKF